MTATPEPAENPDADDDRGSEPATERDMEEADTANGERPPAGE